MCLPCREPSQFLRVFHVVEIREHLPQFADGIGWHAFRAVFRVEPLQALMGEGPYFHRQSVACSLTLIKRRMYARQSRRPPPPWNHPCPAGHPPLPPRIPDAILGTVTTLRVFLRSEEHTSELQSLRHLVCRL